VLDLLPPVTGRVFPVGRLDADTSGLLILTNDGDFAKTLTHPSHEITKTYVATVNKDISDGHIKQLRTKSDKADRLDPRTVQISIHTGKNREVRKMLAFVGLDAVELKRVSIGKLELGNLKSGEYICQNTPPIF